MTCLWYYDFPLAGRCGIMEDNGGVARVFLADGSGASDIPRIETDLLCRAAQQLGEYFTGQRRLFDLPLSPAGSPFQRQVWDQLLDIPYGATTSYKALATTLGRPNSARAVGQAVGANPLPFLIPCHRVIGSDGSITGYALGIELKRQLLDLEHQ